MVGIRGTNYNGGHNGPAHGGGEGMNRGGGGGAQECISRNGGEGKI